MSFLGGGGGSPTPKRPSPPPRPTGIDPLVATERERSRRAGTTLLSRGLLTEEPELRRPGLQTTLG